SGEKTWEVEYDIYGKIRKLAKGVASDCPFRYQGQYEDEEIGLYYNRFRYYSPDTGVYISQDPIGIESTNPNIYAYVHDSNSFIDPLGLKELYALLAKEDGWYPVMEWGKKEPIGEMFLKKGELWKLGETKNPSRRYTRKWLKKMNLDKVATHNGPKKLMQMLEGMKLKGYLAWKGFLPPGNKACH
ncbi:RHS repeat-associated core domain-containing protein, partial [Lacinutrix salivirga]